MSDDDFMMDSGDEEYDFEYESAEDSEPDADLENQYYEAKGLKGSNDEGALKAFRAVVEGEPEKGEWGFKALKQSMKIYFRQNKYSEFKETFKQLLTYIKSAVTKNYSEKSINSILEYVSSSKQVDLLQDVYEMTLNALREANNERLWFKTNIKLGKTFLAQEQYPKLDRTLKELLASCRNEEGEDDHKKGTQLLEVYALNMQMCTALEQNKKIKELLERCSKVTSAIPHPNILGIIKECGGKMHLREQQYTKAYEDFFEAFKNYDESGSNAKIDCLKYLVLANMLMQSDVDPFDAPESKPYKSDTQIVAMTSLVAAYQSNDIRQFEKILKTNEKSIMGDAFIRNYIEELKVNVRVGVMVKLIRPYTCVTLEFIADELRISIEEVEDLLVMCICDGLISGKIDQTQGILQLDSASESTSRYNAMMNWASSLESLALKVTQKVM